MQLNLSWLDTVHNQMLSVMRLVLFYDPKKNALQTLKCANMLKVKLFKINLPTSR